MSIHDSRRAVVTKRQTAFGGIRSIARISVPYSSEVRIVRDVIRNVVTSFLDSYTPKVIFVFPTSITKIILSTTHFCARFLRMPSLC